MDRKEAILRIKSYIEARRLVAGPHYEKNTKAMEMAVEALDRLTPKEPIYFKFSHEWRCRGCHCILKSASKHCPTCGQAIDWIEAYKNAGEKNNETVGN